MTKREAAGALYAVYQLLPQGRQQFALSLLDQLIQNGDLSQNQWHWVVKLTQIATETKPQTDFSPAGRIHAAAPTVFKPIVDMLKRAASGRERLPSFLALAAGGIEVRLKLAGAHSKHPGSVNLTWAGHRDGDSDRDIWFGRITTEGRLEPSQHFTPAVGAALQAVVDDPVAAAKAFAEATSVCCFCAAELTDPRSKAVGYGPICAEKFGLPWGERQPKAALKCDAA